jgi:hypothetical protein
MRMSRPPTWTTLAAGIKSPAPVDGEREALIGRVRAEYREMPGLCLTVQQGCRLWQIDAGTCTRILDVLVAESFLRRTATGAFITAASGPP